MHRSRDRKTYRSDGFEEAGLGAKFFVFDGIVPAYRDEPRMRSPEKYF